ncbi:MAG: glutamate--tRNA ligase [Candidatus Omnitrophica bacterium]|nr:glutamate--tRNA ligase [Candidatus Omnitrophota bacterium]MDD5236444.1 glutamate--tRNA ligase [Candidatus Omnitrophota bacterium]MDD5610748.1 glutamate--tRNA ligase [Candidatus Omnitrophota bacterium]
MLRVRFAPSPTGYLHIGGSRTALFNWLYAKARCGKFILRIEDTDQARSKKEFLDEILESLKWLGMDWDELYYQSQRFSIYKEHAQKLLDKGLAYLEGPAIIFKVTPQIIKVEDLIRGEIEFDSSTIKPQVLIKTDGTPTYNFACVVDDALMNITHIIRGDDHISNTPKQVLLYNALGFPLPKFAHIPLIMGEEGGRLSKRTGATAISDYRKMGYLPEALMNYLMLLAWSPGENQEIIDVAGAIQRFDIAKVNKTAAVFDIDKLNWINNFYIKNADPQRLLGLVIPLLAEKGLIEKDNPDKDHILSIVKLFQPRLNTLGDFPGWADFFFQKEINIEPKAQEKFLSKDLSREFRLFIQRLELIKDFNIATIEEAFRAVVKELNIESKALIHPIRVALTGKTIGPGLFEVIYYLGLESTRQRLEKWIKK